jgi:hypothetical protein
MQGRREPKIAEKLMPAEPQVHLQLARAQWLWRSILLRSITISNSGWHLEIPNTYPWPEAGQIFSIIVEGDCQARANSVRLHQALSLEPWFSGSMISLWRLFKRRRCWPAPGKFIVTVAHIWNRRNTMKHGIALDCLSS